MHDIKSALAGVSARAAALVTATCLTVGTALAAYPERPITMIVPFAAGGPTDTVARIVGEHMSKTLGQTIVIENVTGAGGTTGITRGAQAAPDGYTIMMGHMGTHGASPALYPNLKYDPTKDFTPIGMAAGTPIIIVTKKDFPAKDLKEFVAKIKADGPSLNEGNAGVGSVSHTTCTLLTSQLAVKTARVTYKGTGPMINDLVGGQIDFGCDQIVSVAPQIKAGTIKALAIATPERSPALPDVPTTKEAGMPEYEVSAWNAVFAPKGIPADIAAKLSDSLIKALDDENTRKRLLELGSVLPEGEARTPAALQKLVESEVARWKPVLRDVAAAAVNPAAATSGQTPAPAAAPAAPK
ncbi:MAG: tripartite tricarboxylate transporter substrate-binding protein [Hyphomicrobiaceae bacterium]|nr:tripartite tricarboxylate transporter substrate-binding protein [Hyphomicrobiaceae bacterium]